MLIFGLVAIVMVGNVYANDLCGNNQCLPLNYDQTQPPNDTDTVYGSFNHVAGPYVLLTQVDDTKFTLTLSTTFYSLWEDSRINLKNLTKRELGSVGVWLQKNIWMPDLQLTQLQSLQPTQFLSKEALCKKDFYELLNLICIVLFLQQRLS